MTFPIQMDTLLAVTWKLGTEDRQLRYQQALDKMQNVDYPSPDHEDWYVYNGLLWLYVMECEGKKGSLTREEVMSGSADLDLVRKDIEPHAGLFSPVIEEWKKSSRKRFQP